MQSSRGGENIGVRVIAVRVQIMPGNEAKIKKGAGEGGFHAQHRFGFEMLPCANERKMGGMTCGDEQIRVGSIAPSDYLDDFTEDAQALEVNGFNAASRPGNEGFRQPQGLIDVALFAIAQNPDVHMGLL